MKTLLQYGQYLNQNPCRDYAQYESNPINEAFLYNFFKYSNNPTWTVQIVTPVCCNDDIWNNLSVVRTVRFNKAAFLKILNCCHQFFGWTRQFFKFAVKNRFTIYQTTTTGSIIRIMDFLCRIKFIINSYKPFPLKWIMRGGFAFSKNYHLKFTIQNMLLY